MSEKKYWRVELDKVTRYATYVVADTLEAAFAIAYTVEEDEVREVSVEWLGSVQGEVSGREILIRADMIAAVTQYSAIDNPYGSMKQYWTTKVIMTSGKEISLREPYSSIVTEWTEASLYE